MNNDPRSPLKWPAGRPRTAPGDRKRSAFGGMDRGWKTALSLFGARQRLEEQLSALRVRDYVMSSNLILNKDGSPRSGQGEPADVGVAIYFELKGKDIVLACDRWDRTADNLVAIAKHIEALRGQDRWSVGSIEQAFAGYAALPAPGQHSRRSWRQVFGFPPGYAVTLDALDGSFRELARKHHPDLGGDQARFAELTQAREDARAELGK